MIECKMSKAKKKSRIKNFFYKRYPQRLFGDFQIFSLHPKNTHTAVGEHRNQALYNNNNLLNHIYIKVQYKTRYRDYAELLHLYMAAISCNGTLLATRIASLSAPRCKLCTHCTED